MTILAAVVGYIAMWIVTWSGLLAYVQRKPMWRPFAKEEFSEDLGFAMLLAFIPVTWFMAPFMTGFYKYGFQFGPPK